MFLSVLVATLIFVNSSLSAFVDDVEHGIGNTTGSTQDPNGSDSNKQVEMLSDYQQYLQWVARRKKEIRPIDVISFLPTACKVARSVPSLFLSPQQKVAVVEGFVKIVSIKSMSGQEAAIRKELKHRLHALGFIEIPCGAITDPNAPLNLVVELSASKNMEGWPAIILNAHMDTIHTDTWCTPEEMTFDADLREFYHNRDKSFGADDKAGVITIISALEAVKTSFWDKGIEHRRIIVIFSAQDENGGHGARYLAEHHPELFENIEITLMTDGPLDYRNGEYPDNAFIIVVDKEVSRTPPFREVMTFIREMSRLKEVSYLTTEAGLGHGDIKWFPDLAKTDLHIRAPYQGNHSKERVKLDDLFNHIDFFTYILLRFDKISLELDKESGRLVLVNKQDAESSADEDVIELTSCS